MKKRTKVIIGLSVFSLVLGIGGFIGQKAYAARTNTAVVCKYRASPGTIKTFSNGTKYISVEYAVLGNDNSRRFLDTDGQIKTEPGWNVNSASAGCQPDFLSGLFWDGKEVDLSSDFYKAAFGYRDAVDVIFGVPTNGSYTPAENYYANSGIGKADQAQGLNAKRPQLGITPYPGNNGDKNTIFATVNDAGYVMIGGQRAWCVGMAGVSGGSGCRGGDAANVYVGGGDWAGYQNSNNANALANVSSAYRNKVKHGGTIEQRKIDSLIGYSQADQKFSLSLSAFNTRDATPPHMSNQCKNAKPGQSPCIVGFGDPQVNAKSSVVLTYILGDFNPNLDGGIQSAGCKRITGWAADSDDYSRQIGINLIFDQPSEALGGKKVSLVPDTDGGNPEEGEYKIINHAGMTGAGAVPANPWHGFEVPESLLSRYADAYPRTVFLEVVGLDGVTETIGSRTFGPCAPPTCKNSAAINPSPPAANQDFTASVGLNYSKGALGRDMRYDIVLNIVNANTGASITGTPATSSDLTAFPQTQNTFSGLRQAGTGPYQARWRIRWNNTYDPNAVVNGGQRELLCTDDYNVGDRPYVRVYGNDIAVGSAFGNDCNLRDENAIIATWSRFYTASGETVRAGASTQFAAFALGQIDGFYSASLRNKPIISSRPNPHNGLTFGNFTGTSGVNPDGTAAQVTGWGGFSGLRFCMQDFFAKGEAAGENILNGNRNVINDGLGGNATISQGQHRAVYVEGNAYIDNRGITYQNASGNWGSSTANIPSFYLVVKGNIYIDPQAANLDGVYIAQPRILADGSVDSSTGKIFTCANSSGVTPTTYTGCQTTLTINGAFVARQVHFQRTNGRVNTATYNETAADTSNVAEVFKFSPEIYLSPLHSSLSRSLPYSKYDYITSLPPVL